jgi:hypothetical protein
VRESAQPDRGAGTEESFPAMSSPPTPDERYAALVEALRGTPGVTAPANLAAPGKKFGDAGLKTGGKIFAMLAQGRLVVKLPRPRVDALVAAGSGERFEPGHGRVMKEWLSLDPAAKEEWLPLAREALEFVASRA